MTDSAYCGIDVGTQGVRAVVVDADGRELGSGSHALAPGLRSAVRHEQDPDGWSQAMVAAVRTALDGVEHDVVAVALDATSGTVLVEDVDGRAIGPALMYDDARAAEQAARVQQVGQELWSALGYRMQASWALPKVLWLLTNGLVPSGHRVVHQSDHLVRRLTGGPVPTDTSNALKSGADLRDATWPRDVLDELGVPAGALPELALPTTDVGTVSPEAAAATGLPESCRVRLGMTDGCAAQIAAGAVAQGRWSSALGTTLVLKGSTSDPVRDPSGAVYSHRHPDGGWLPGGASSCGAGIFTTLLEGRDLDALTAEAARRGVGDAVVYPLAGRGERFPFVAGDAQRFELPEGVDLDEADLFGACCLGLAYVERLAYDVLSSLGAEVDGAVMLTGGATANDWLNQLRSDVLGRPTARPTTSGAATGMAVLAAAEPGALTAAAERMVGTDLAYEPDAARGDRLEAGYRSFVAELVDRGWLAPVGAGQR